MQSASDTRISTISLDYDGCAYILFEQNRDGIVSLMLNLLASKPQLKAFVEENEAQLKLKIDEFITVIQGKLQSSIDECLNSSQRRILLVGSNRQDPAIDLLNSIINKTHLCFQLFREYSEQYGFEFCELLLGDIYDLQGNKREMMLPIGTTIDLLHNPLKVRNYKYPQSN
ncbi:MAG: hypothetical protein QG556_721 [Pseudomonadota bacterium]|nr:hypothetical protein [Pseudomonadota bacterium]